MLISVSDIWQQLRYSEYLIQFCVSDGSGADKKVSSVFMNWQAPQFTGEAK